jgi:Domain of unknown function (DUF4175)
VTEIASSTPAPAHRGAERSVGSALATALRRARWMIFWERLWPALAMLATAAGLFLTISWLGLWLWLPPLGRAATVLAFAQPKRRHRFSPSCLLIANFPPPTRRCAP